LDRSEMRDLELARFYLRSPLPVKPLDGS